MHYIVSVANVGSSPTSHPMKETDIAWAAGLFEGEGSITIIGNRVRAVNYSGPDPYWDKELEQQS
jgi:hypothetical protein